MNMAEEHQLQSLLSLLRLSSPALPVGAYSYSQGLEYAIECGWVVDYENTALWLQGVMDHGLCYLEVPLLRNCYQALEQENIRQLDYWNQQALAFRETRELRLEDLQMGRALWRLLDDLDHDLPLIEQAGWIAAFAVAAHGWNISLQSAANGLLWSWLENQLAAAGKLVPLGQTDIQRLTSELMPRIPNIVETGLGVEDEEIGMGMPGMVLGSILHETQYSRLFRS
jgi:urease accessory protein